MQTGLRLIRCVKGNFLEGISEKGLFRSACRKRVPTCSRELSLVRGGSHEGHPGGTTAALAVVRGVRERPANAEWIDRIRARDTETPRPQQSRTAGTEPLHPVLGRSAHRIAGAPLSVADGCDAFEI